MRRGVGKDSSMSFASWCLQLSHLIKFRQPQGMLAAAAMIQVGGGAARHEEAG